MTDLKWGVMVTAKVEEGGGSIVQVTFIEYSNEEKESYSATFLRLEKPLLSFIFNDIPMKRGFLLGDDFPERVTEKSKVVLKSRYKVWCCVYKHFKKNGPFMPLYLFKHSSQYKHNKGKWGLDKSTENSMKVELQLNNVSMEEKVHAAWLKGPGCVTVGII